MLWIRIKKIVCFLIIFLYKPIINNHPFLSKITADQIPFEDLISSGKETIDPREMDIEAVQFFDELLSEKKADLLELFASQPHGTTFHQAIPQSKF